MASEPTISDIYYKLGALESKIDSSLILQSNDRRRIEALEERTDNLEKVEAKRTGVITVLVAVFSVISTVVVNFITSHINVQ